MPLCLIEEDDEVCQEYTLLEDISTDSSHSDLSGDKAHVCLYPKTLSMDFTVPDELSQNQIIEIPASESYDGQNSQSES